MLLNGASITRFSKPALRFVWAVSLLLPATPIFSAGVKSETIEASAMGTGTQMGSVIGITLNINEFSTPADRVVLVQAFEKGQNQGLVNCANENESSRSC